MNIYSVPSIIALIFNLGFISQLANSGKHKQSSARLLAIILLFTGWHLVDLVSLNFATPKTALFTAQITYRILFLLPSFMLSFSLLYYREKIKKLHIGYYVIIYGLPILILALSFPNFNLNIIAFNNPKAYYFSLSLVPNAAFYSILGISVFYIFMSVYLLRKLQNKSLSIDEKTHLKWFLWGFSTLFFTFLLIHFLSSYIVKYSQLYFLKTSFLFFEIFILYTLVHQITRNKTKLISQFYKQVIFVIVLAIYILLINVLIQIIDNYFAIKLWYFDALQIIVYTIFFQSVESNIQRYVQSKLNYKLLNYRKNFLLLSKELLTIVPFELLLQKIKQFIKINYNTQNLFFFKWIEEGAYYEIINSEKKVVISGKNEFITSIKTHIVNDMHELSLRNLPNEAKTFFDEFKIQLILPLTYEKHIFMFITLGAKKKNKDYSTSEIEILNIFLNEINLHTQRNWILEKLRKKEKEEFRLEKLAALGQLTAGIAHEIRNPLNTISSAAQTLARPDLQADQQARMIKYMNEEIERINDLMNDFLQLSRLKKPEYEEFSLEKLINKITVFLNERNPNINLVISNQIKNNIWTDKKYLYQILLNLVTNSIDAIEKRCLQEPDFCDQAKIQIFFFKDSQNIYIQIEDNGIGIEKENSEKIFEPFFTLKESGTGLGLALINNMLKSLEGSIRLTKLKKNTTFILKLKRTR